MNRPSTSSSSRAKRPPSSAAGAAGAGPTGPSAPVTARGARTRQKLVDAAERIFGDVGYEAASISDITREAGVALGTFYVYFADKKGLFVEVVDNLGERLRAHLGEAVAGVGEADRLAVEEAGLRAFFGFAAAHRLLYRIVRQAEFVDPDCFRRYYRRIAEPYAKGLQDAMTRGELKPMDAETLAWALMGVADFLGMRYVLWGKKRPPEEVIQSALAFIRGGIAAGHDPQKQKPRPPRRSKPS